MYSLFTIGVTLFCQAAELLTHPHLQPYVLKIHLNLNRPRQTIPNRWSDSNYIKRTRFVEPETISIHSVKVKRMSFSNDRTLNPSISGTEQDSVCSSQRAQVFEFPSMSQKFAELSVGCMHKEYDLDKSITSKFSSVSKTPRLTPRKISATPKRQTTPSKISHIVSKRDSVSIHVYMVNATFQLHFSCNISMFLTLIADGITSSKTSNPLYIFLKFSSWKKIESGILILCCGYCEVSLHLLLYMTIIKDSCQIKWLTKNNKIL